MAVTDYDPTPANNTTISGIAIGEGLMAPNSTNNVIRQMMADIATMLINFDADTVDGLEASQFLRSDVEDSGQVLNLNRIRLVSTADAGLLSSGHGFQVGLDGGANLAIDTNEIMARNNGAAATLDLNFEGGAVRINANMAFHSANFRLGAESVSTATLPSGVGGDLGYDAPAGHVLTGITITRDTSENIQSVEVKSRPVQYQNASGTWVNVTAA